MNVKLYNYYYGIANKDLLATFSISENDVSCKREKYEEDKVITTLWGEYLTRRRYIDSAWCQLIKNKPQESDKPEYRYVYDYKNHQKTPIACIVKVKDQFGVSIVSDKKNIKYKVKSILPLELSLHCFTSGELLTEKRKNDVVEKYWLHTPIGYEKDAFNYVQARKMAHDHIGQTIAIPHRTIRTYYGYEMQLDEIIPEMMENWYTTL